MSTRFQRSLRSEREKSARRAPPARRAERSSGNDRTQLPHRGRVALLLHAASSARSQVSQLSAARRRHGVRLGQWQQHEATVDDGHDWRQRRCAPSFGGSLSADSASVIPRRTRRCTADAPRELEFEGGARLVVHQGSEKLHGATVWRVSRLPSAAHKHARWPVRALHAAASRRRWIQPRRADTGPSLTLQGCRPRVRARAEPACVARCAAAASGRRRIKPCKHDAVAAR